MNVFLFKWLLALTALVGACGWFLGADVLQAVGDRGRSLMGSVPERAAAPDAGADRATWRIEPEVNNVHNVTTRPVSLHRIAPDRVDVGIDLKNLGGANDFPDLMLSFLDQSGRVVRSTVIASSVYPHPSQFTHHHVDLEVPIAAGEVSLDIKPGYPAGTSP